MEDAEALLVVVEAESEYGSEERITVSVWVL